LAGCLSSGGLLSVYVKPIRRDSHRRWERHIEHSASEARCLLSVCVKPIRRESRRRPQREEHSASEARCRAHPQSRRSAQTAPTEARHARRARLIRKRGSPRESNLYEKFHSPCRSPLSVPFAQQKLARYLLSAHYSVICYSFLILPWTMHGSLLNRSTAGPPQTQLSSLCGSSLWRSLWSGCYWA